MDYNSYITDFTDQPVPRKNRMINTALISDEGLVCNHSFTEVLVHKLIYMQNTIKCKPTTVEGKRGLQVFNQGNVRGM